MMTDQHLIDELSIWDEAVKHFNENKFEKSIEEFNKISIKTSRILFNIAACHVRLHQYEKAIQALSACLEKDKHLVIALCQRAVCLHLLRKNSGAVEDLASALALIGKRHVINYHPMGLSHKITDSEIMYNMAAVLSAQRKYDEAGDWLLKIDATNNVIKRDCLDASHGTLKKQQTIDIIALPDFVVFRPDKSMLASVAKKNYLGKALVIAQIADDSALNSKPSSSVCLPSNTDLKRSKSRDDLTTDHTSANIKTSGHRVVNLDPRRRAEFYRDMPRVPPPRLMAGKSPALTALMAAAECKPFRLPPPRGQDRPLRSNKGAVGEYLRSEEVRAPGLEAVENCRKVVLS